MKKIKIITICTILIMLVNVFLPIAIYANTGTEIDNNEDSISTEKNETENQENSENISENTVDQNQSEEVVSDDANSEDQNKIDDDTNHSKENISEDEEMTEEPTKQEEMIKEEEKIEEETENETMQIQTYSNLVIEDGIYIIRSALNKNKVLDIAWGGTNSGANLQIWSYDDKVNQQRFRITSDGDGYYTIEAVHSKKVLDVENANKKSGTNVRQYDSNKTDAQKWKILDLGNGQVSFVSKCNGLYLDIDNAGTSNGTNVQVYEGNGSNAQKFILEKNEYKAEQTIQDGIYTIKSKLNTNRVVDVSGGSYNNSANIQLWENDNVRQQRFKITYNKEGYYKIEALHSGKVLDVANGGMTSGTNIQQ